MPKDTHQTTIDRAQLELPEQVTVAVAELAGPKGRQNPTGQRFATAPSRAR